MGRRPCRGFTVLLALCALLSTSSCASAVTKALKTSSDTTSGKQRSGLITAGNSKTACIYAGIGSTLQQAERATGLTYKCVETFSNADPSWADWVSPWLTHLQYGYAEWLAADPTQRTVILTQNLIPDSVSTDPNWRAKGAAGDYKRYARQLAINLVSSGFGHSVIRLGAEANGIWVRDTIGNTPTQYRQWAEFFAQIVKTMRAVSGAHFLFDWNILAGYRAIPLESFYPGDKYTDIVGIDDYDQSATGPLPPPSSPQRWELLSSEPDGLDITYSFARQHSKPLSIPEWGTVDAPGAGDDGAYVTQMGKFVASHVVAFQSWFDTGSDAIFQLTKKSAPRSLAAYVRIFSSGR